MARKATTLQLVFMTYSVICSGAYGLEEMVSGSGPGMTLLTLMILPFIWAVPVALACAELSDRPDERQEDRKSTRLNSSHDQISYAVFCLKKKKNNSRTRLTLVDKRAL